MSTKDTLSAALSKLQRQYLNIAKGLAQARGQTADLKPEIKSAIELLVKEYQHPQGIMAVVQSVAQVASFDEAKGEVEALIASIQVSIGEVSDEVLDAQLAANTEVLKSPLPSAGSSSAIDPANQATLDEVSASAQAAGDSGNPGS